MVCKVIFLVVNVKYLWLGVNTFSGHFDIYIMVNIPWLLLYRISHGLYCFVIKYGL